MGHAHEFLETQRAVVQRARQAESEVDQGRLARAIALIHAADLRDGGVGLIGDEQKVLGKEVDQGARAASGETLAEMAAVVLDALAKPHLLHHLQIIVRPLADALRLISFCSFSNFSTVSSSSWRMVRMARRSLSAGVTNCFAG